eukprot:gene772-4060_t
MDTDNNDSTQPALEDIASFDVNELFRSQSETSQRSPVSYSSTGESASRNDNNEEKSDLEESYANTSCSASIPPLHTVPSVFFQRNKHYQAQSNQQRKHYGHEISYLNVQELEHKLEDAHLQLIKTQERMDANDKGHRLNEQLHKERFKWKAAIDEVTEHHEAEIEEQKVRQTSLQEK